MYILYSIFKYTEMDQCQFQIFEKELEDTTKGVFRITMAKRKRTQKTIER